MSKKNKIGVILANLGAPAKQEDIYPFLRNLFSDRDIFSLPFGAWGQKIFSRIIARLRTPKSSKYYQLIGGGSPLPAYTKKLAHLVSDDLQAHGGFSVYYFQRYWHPQLVDIRESLAKHEWQKLILLPLFPHYSTTTTLSIINEWQRFGLENPNPQIIRNFYYHDDFIQCWCDQISKYLAKFTQPPHILFSAHAIPVKRVKNGDPYEREINDNVELIMKALNRDYSYSLAYQSKIGPVQWLGPTFEEEIDRLLVNHRKRILVVPLSFICENLETLYELDIEKKEYARQKGIVQYERVHTVQYSDSFPQFLARIIRESPS